MSAPQRRESIIPEHVTGHYSDGGLLGRLLAVLQLRGADLDRLDPDDLAPFEEFHIGGRPATAYAVGKMGLKPSDRVLDVGCGIGGAVRYIARTIGCEVHGVDLTPEYIEVARDLSARVGLGRNTRFDIANALDLPFSDADFDAAITLHAAMNIADREGLYSEIARVLRPGATFCIFDVMDAGAGKLEFPVPWAASPAISHLMTPEALARLLGDVGFRVQEVEDRAPIAIEFFETALAAATDASKPQGVNVVMGETAKQKFGNTLEGVKNGSIAPVLVLAEWGG